MKKKPTNARIEVRGNDIRVVRHQDEDYISLTDIAKSKNADHPDDLIRNWLRNRNTLVFLGIWEQLHNPCFNPVEFDGIKKQAGLNSFTLTPKQWIQKTAATGIVSKAGRYGTREDVVFLINGIPVLVIECKNANKDQAIALGVDQIRRYHRETPELFLSQQLFTAADAIGFSYGVSWNTVRRNIFNWKLTESGFSNPLLENKGGQECPRSVGSSFFNPYHEIEKTTHHLPHWQQGQAWMFVTWRLRNSLPKAKLNQWKEERAIWLSLHPKPWDEKTEAEYHERFSRQIDEWLDQGSGASVLKDPANAKIVAGALRHFDGDRYELASFVVMPNHVHVLFRPLGDHALAAILKSWKGFTAREINRRIGKTGALWQDEYFDRLIRNERHFFKVAEYIRENPVKAKLPDGTYLLWERNYKKAG